MYTLILHFTTHCDVPNDRVMLSGEAKKVLVREIELLYRNRELKGKKKPNQNTTDFLLWFLGVVVCVVSVFFCFSLAFCFRLHDHICFLLF